MYGRKNPTPLQSKESKDPQKKAKAARKAAKVEIKLLRKATDIKVNCPICGQLYSITNRKKSRYHRHTR